MKQAKVLTDAEIKRVLAVCAQQQHGARNRLLVLAITLCRAKGV